MYYKACPDVSVHDNSGLHTFASGLDSNPLGIIHMDMYVPVDTFISPGSDENNHEITTNQYATPVF